jgi:hypothetical protein
LTDKKKLDLNEAWLSSQSLPVVEPPQCDVEKYRDNLKDMDLTAEEEAELLHNLWMIMAAFVDLGFGVDSIQFLAESAEKQNASSSD